MFKIGLMKITKSEKICDDKKSEVKTDDKTSQTSSYLSIFG